MSLADNQRRVDAWISQFEEGYFHPLTNIARLTEEVGELAREVNHRFGQKTKKQHEPEGDLTMEMADILFVLICMANREGIDLDEAFGRMMAKVEGRDRDRWTRKEAKGGLLPLPRRVRQLRQQRAIAFPPIPRDPPLLHRLEDPASRLGPVPAV